MNLTNDNGRSTHCPEGARPVTSDGRLLWCGPILPHQQHEFFLDGVNLGCVTLEQAMGLYSRSAPVHRQSKTDPIVSHTSAPPFNTPGVETK